MKKIILSIAIVSTSIILSAFENNVENLTIENLSGMKISYTENFQNQDSGQLDVGACDKALEIEKEDSNTQDGFKANMMKCGFKPFPPIGCKIGRCICNSSGNNCEWEVVC